MVSPAPQPAWQLITQPLRVAWALMGKAGEATEQESARGQGAPAPGLLAGSAVGMCASSRSSPKIWLCV